MRKRSEPFPQLQAPDAIPASVEVLRSEATGMPLTCGVRQPAIIFPHDAANRDEETQRAVLTHELTHIRRRDLFFLMISAAAIALHWPNPLVWLAARRMRLADERAADDAVRHNGLDESEYARLLFDLARGNTTPTSCLAAQFMAERSTLGTRIKCLLNPRQNRSAPRPVAMAGGSLFVLAAALLVGTATVREISAEPVKKAEDAKKTDRQVRIETMLKEIRIPVIDFSQATQRRLEVYHSGR